MSDVEFQRFWQSIKRAEWPDVDTYGDFRKLSADIQQEANDRHPIQNMLDIISDPEKWAVHLIAGWKYQDLVYVPVFKCAHTYYSTVFTDMGWQEINIQDIDVDQHKLFGLLMHPLDRWLKGITQWIWMSYKFNSGWDKLQDQLQTPDFQAMIHSVLIGDHHTLPYNLHLGSLLDKIHWIPMEMFDDNGIKLQLMEFFARNGHPEIQLKLNDDRLNQSNPYKLQILDCVKSHYLSNRNRQLFLYSIYAKDLDFYHKLVDKFSNH